MSRYLPGVLGTCPRGRASLGDRPKARRQSGKRSSPDPGDSRPADRAYAGLIPTGLGRRRRSGAGTEEGTQRGRAKLLRCLPANLSRHEIAAELPVPVDTVSTHIRSIYTKPQVSNRSSAVQHARELRLLAVARQESRTSNYRAQMTAAHLDGKYLERTRSLSREGAVPMTGAFAPDPLARGTPAPADRRRLQGQDHQDRWCTRCGRVNHRDLVAPPNLPGGNPGSGPPPGQEISGAK
jgi:DNA-binding CsgD family transcriptional regulator